MIDTKALRNKVLDLAIQGKLTKQLESDGTAEELFVQIQEEKQNLIKEGKIKKEKPFPSISDDEIPFKIPKSWKWTHLGEIFQHNTGKALNSSNTDGNLFEYLTTSNVYWDKFDFSVIKKMHFTDAEIEKCTIRRGDLLICEGGDIGRSAIWLFDYDMKIQNHLHRLRAYYPEISSKYYLYIMKIYKEIGLIDGRGIGLQGFSSTRVHNLVVPLPPFAEQKRIVKRVEEIFKLLDIIDKAQNKYSADAEILKNKLITMGIQGKLTERLESDGTAEELFIQIQEEKQKLIKEGKIKKEKPLPPVSDEEIPFKIPQNWKLAHLGEIFQHNTGKALNSSNTDGILFEYLTTSNVYWDKFDFSVIKKMHFTDAEIEKCTIRRGDLLICEGGDIGRSAIWSFDYDMKIQNHLHRLRAYYPEISSRYYLYIMKIYKEIGVIDGRGIGLQGFSSKRVHNLVVPLPPLAEQKRIVDILDKVIQIVI